MTDPHSRVRQTIEDSARDLLDLSHHIHSNPELSFEEHDSAALLQEILAGRGFSVQSGVGGLETAFMASVGEGEFHVGFFAEYDALPEIGHACGHNIIASSAVGAAIGLASVAESAGLKVTVVGTPAEEGGGGKILMLEAGVFEPLHAALMVHPGAKDFAAMPTLATAVFDVRYSGVAAHASAFPERGVNALDATTVTQVAIGLLRQHLPSTDRIHGIVTDGGAVPQVVPAAASMLYQLRSATVEALAVLEARARRCFEAGALATGAEVEIIRASPVYADLREDDDLTNLYVRHVESLGRTVSELTPRAQRAAGSTDMGNVSHVLPAIHPMIGIGSLPAVPHQPGFAQASVSDEADRAVIDASIALAWTGLDAAMDSSVRNRLLNGQLTHSG
jgi:amidohydrolase